MKYLKYLFFIAFSFFILSADVSADELDNSDLHEYSCLCYDGILSHDIIGVTFDEFIYHLDNVGPYIFSLPEPFYIQNPDWLIESPMRLKNGKISTSCVRSSQPTNYSKELDFGETFLFHDMISAEMVLENNGQPLFEVGGRLTLMVISQARSGTYTVYRSDGSSDSYNFTGGSDSLNTIPMAFENANNDLIKIVFRFDAPAIEIHPGYTMNIMSYGIQKYGYIVATDEPEPEPDAPVISVGGNTGDALKFLTDASVSIVSSLFLLEVFAGITLGNFILACLLLSIVFGFFFSRMIK